MEPFGLTAIDWGLVALVVFPLAQLPLVFYLARYVESEGPPLGHAVEFRGVAPGADTDDASNRADPDPERARDRTRDDRSRDARRSSAPSTLACPACGVANDPGFTFCRCCVARLSRPRPPAGRTSPR